MDQQRHPQRDILERDMSSRKPDQPLTLHLNNLAQQSPLTGRMVCITPRYGSGSSQEYISIGLGFIIAIKGP
jgi:hypothetical protein